MTHRKDIRNIVIIAHVDHGKTTLVDCLLRQSGQFRESQLQGERILDSGDIEKERGITILAKNIALPYKGVKINIIDTPGHADFGGEVERVLKMADGALLLVDAAEGPMPQTRFVLGKALEAGLKPIVVVNKVDRPDARTAEVVDEAMELILEMGGEEYLDNFHFIYASAKEGFATHQPNTFSGNMEPLLDLVLEQVAPPTIEPGKFRMGVTTMDWSEFVGRIAVGKILSGCIKKGQSVNVIGGDGIPRQCKISTLNSFDKLGRIEVERAEAGEVVAIMGIEDIEIGDTICDLDVTEPLPRISVDEPTLEMVFSINSSPLVGKEGKYVTSRQLRERLTKELDRNVALRVRPMESGDSFAVAGRGILHLAVLIETMRREGFELSVGKPKVVIKEIDGQQYEPFESLVVEVPTDKFGPVMEMVGNRRGELQEMAARGEFTLANFVIPSRGLIGMRTKMLNATQGTAIINHRFLEFRLLEGEIAARSNGVMISMVPGKAVGFAIFGLQQRADMFVSPGDDVYEGMIVGENARSNDLPVNPTRAKQLTNIRAAGSDENILLKPARLFSLESALEYVEDDEWVEITPSNIRLRKMLLKESDRKRANRAALANK
ncbi:translational GTPase TypA [Mariniblastus sp.]|nr:translational GTPase TypA [Mariniblastus sp.]MDA7923097.1 translational GTPase TypA [bacterium]MDB4357446.1 translational GTPase TypA [Mariniblastus sp.]MDB4372646.1 translational GTPase TypA [Mariniblastus sp.]